MTSKGICRSTVCEREVWRIGLCAPHYGRHRRGGPIDTPIREKRDVVGVLHRSTEGDKLCSVCKLWKPEEGFYKAKKFADGLLPQCKSCHRFGNISTTYGLSREAYLALESAQGDACAVCRIHKDDYKQTWAVDHDHSCCPGERACGKCVRGLLCINCNIGLGNFQDSVKLLTAATNYLKDRANG